jgi:hypothetical protein
LSGGFDVFLGLGRVGRLGSVFGSCVSAVCVAGFCVCVVSVACVISHVSILMSGACPSIWHLSVSDRPGAAVVPRWNPMRCSLIVALGSDSVSLWYRRPVPGIPACVRKAGEFRWHVILGSAICGGSGWCV